MKMRLVCAWCRTEMGTVDGGGQDDAAVSHGICAACKESFAMQGGVTIQRYLDGLAAPVLLVDDDAAVMQLNAAAQEMLGKTSSEATHKRIGNVFECAYARLPEGCGRTVHCSGCAIRRAVTKTYETGVPQSMVPATLHRGDADRPADAELLITTVKVGDMVILRIDGTEPSAKPKAKR